MKLTRALLEKVSETVEYSVRPIIREYSVSIDCFDESRLTDNYYNNRRTEIYKDVAATLLVALDNEGLMQ